MRTLLLKKILWQPTAPYREMHVQRVVSGELESDKVPHFFDSVGNLVVGASSAREYKQKVNRRSNEPLRVYIAHTDHPGFHGVKWSKENVLNFKWYGGSPTKHLVGSGLWLADKSGIIGEGKLTSVKMIKSGRAIDSGQLRVTQSSLLKDRPKPHEIFGGFAFRSPVWQKGNRIFTNAADDLAGVFCITSLAKELYRKKSPDRNNFIAVLTRAEEVGFIGTIGHLNLGWLNENRRPVVCVNLEASRTLPGAVIGEGPVVRLGDRMTVFNPDGIRVLTRLAQKVLKGKFQRRIMDGGACEATAVTAFGFPAVGISLPLGNYHNQSFEGGPDSRGPRGPAPEFVDVRDVEGMLKLCRAIVRKGTDWDSPWKETVVHFRKSLKASKRLLG